MCHAFGLLHGYLPFGTETAAHFVFAFFVAVEYAAQLCCFGAVKTAFDFGIQMDTYRVGRAARIQDKALVSGFGAAGKAVAFNLGMDIEGRQRTVLRSQLALKRFGAEVHVELCAAAAFFVVGRFAPNMTCFTDDVCLPTAFVMRGAGGNIFNGCTLALEEERHTVFILSCGRLKSTELEIVEIAAT